MADQNDFGLDQRQFFAEMRQADEQFAFEEEQRKFDEEAGFFEKAGSYIGETLAGIPEAIGEGLAGAYLGTETALAEGIKDYTSDTGMLGSLARSDFAQSIAREAYTPQQLGEISIQQQREKERSIWEGAAVTPEEISGVGSSVALNVLSILFPPAMLATIPTMGAMAFDGVTDRYFRTLAENPDMEYDPKIMAGLSAIAALETVGGVGTGIALPMKIAKGAGGKLFRKAVAEGAKEAAENGMRSGGSTFARLVKEFGISMAAEGGEELAEEALEELAAVFYAPEYADFREAVMSGEIGEEELQTMYDIATAGGIKTFALGAAGGGVGLSAAKAKRRFDTREQRAAERAKIAEEIAADVRAGGEVPIGPADAGIPAEDITPEGAEPAAVSPVTLADIDNDEFMDQLIDRAPDAVDEILSKPKTRGGNTLSAWSGLIPEGVKTNRAQRQALWERLKAAKDRRASVEPVAGEVEIGDETLADLRRESEQLTQELIDIQSSDPDFFEDNPAFVEASTRLYDVEQQIEELTGSEPEFSTTAPVTSKRVDAATLQVEPDTQMGSMPGGIAEQPSTGRRFYVKRHRNQEQTRNEAVANRLYDAAGIRVPNAGVLVENGEVVGIASELVAGASEGQGTDVGDGLIIDAWLANWDVVGTDGDNLLVDADGRTVRVDQGGALTTRAMGEPKGDRFGDTVGEIETLPAMNEALANVSPAQLRRGFQALDSVSEQDIKRIVKENSTGDTASDNRLIATLIKRRRDLLSRQDEIIASADTEFSTTAASLELDAVNKSGPDKFAVLTPDQEANLTDGQRQIAENARRRLGKEVVFVRQTSGIQRNGFITSRDSDRIYIVVPVDTQASISRVARERGMSERQVREAYESVLIQTVLHENYHLSEGVDGAELTDDEKAARAAVDAILKVSARVRYNNRIRDLLAMHEAGGITTATLESEIRAEAATDLQSLQQSGVEALFLDRGLLRNAMARIRMLTNRFGSPKEVRIMTSMIRNMSRDGESLVSSPDTVGEVVEFSTNYVPASQRPNYNAAAGYAGNEYVPAVAYQDGTAQQVADAHKKNKRGLYLSPVNVKELQSAIDAGTAIVRITGDGTAGYILQKTGIGWDIQGVFNVGSISGAGKAAVIDAISLGGNTLDCFDGYLPEMYSHFGFAATHELKFDPDQAPTGWQNDDVLGTKPNVVLMTFTGANREKQAIADLAKYYAENKDKRPAREAPEADSWPSDAQRTESPNVQEVRQAAGRADDATSEIVRRVLTPEFSTSADTVIRSHIPYLDYATVVANPTPEGVLDLFVRYRALNTFGKKPSPTDINEESVAREMARIGLPADEAIAKYVAKHYIQAASVAPVSELRGEGEAFGPRGRVENELSNLFDANPSPTAEELSSVTGSPKPRVKHPVIKHKPKGKGDREQMAKKFVENSESWLKKAGVQYAITKNDLEIERLLEKNGAVIFDGEGGPAIHVRAEVMDRHKTTRPYSDIKDATIKAVALGHHNWYREFGREFAQFFGEEALVEAAFVFGVTSAQSPVEVNLADTLFVMRVVREHRRLGKPWTVEALAESMLGVKRRSKYTKTGETLAFISGLDATRMAEFYVNGLGDSDVSIKTRTYSGSVAAAGMNAFYPYSVQDRHMAAMFGFMPGSIDPTSGEYKTDKVFKNPEENRYASYLTQRLSMEEGLRGLTPSQIQSALWFYIKSGQSIYADAEVKQNAGLLKIYESQNPDITSGTLASAIRFAEYELADFRAEIAADSTPLDVGENVPGFTTFKFGHHDYTSGQAHARRLNEIMEGEASRVVLSGYPTIQAPGLTNPLYPMREAAMDEMSQNILSAVTETDGSIRILNDLGVPHTPLMSGVGAVGTSSYRALHLVPLVGSITDPSAARIIGSIVGLGTMQPRMATVQHTPEGKGVTLRVRQSSGDPLTPRQLDHMSKSLGVFGRGESEVIQMPSPRSDFIDVTIIPKSGSVDNATVSSKFDQVSKEIMNETGLEVRAEAFRTNVEIIESKNYAGVISESGLAAGRPSDLLGRVLSEVSTPTLSVLRSSGYQFNRQQFADGHGIDSAVVEASIPMAEFSTSSTSIGIMPIEEQNRLRTEAGGPTFVAGEGRLGEMAAEELRWWSSLEEDDRALIRSWVSGLEVPVVISDPLREMLEFAEPRIASEFWTAMRVTGTIGHGSLAADANVYTLSMFDKSLDVGPNSELEPDHKAEVSKQVALGLAEGLQSVLGMRSDLRALGFGPAEEILVDRRGNWRGQEIRYATVSDAGLIPSDRWEGDRVVTAARIPDNMADYYKDNRNYLRGKDGSNWYVFGGMFSGVSSIDGIVSSILVNAEITPYMASREIGYSLTRRLMPLMDKYPKSLKKIAGLYNRTVEALAKAPKVQGRTYRGHFVSTGEFKSVFRKGDVFRTEAPASMSNSANSAFDFMGGRNTFEGREMADNTLKGITDDGGGTGMDPDSVPIFFVVEAKTARIAHTASLYGDKSSRKGQDTMLGYATYSAERAQSDFEAFVTDETLSENLSQYEGRIGHLANILVEEGHLDRVEADELVANYGALKPSTVGSDEFESVSMPGSSYRVDQIVNNVVYLTEVETSPGDAVQVFPEFSTGSRRSSLAIEPEMSTTTPKSASHGVKFKNKGVRRTVQDKFIELDYLQRDLADAFGSPIAIEEDAVNALRLIPGEMAFKAERFQESVAKPLARDVAALGLTQAEFGEYCAALHALDVNRELRAASSAAAGGSIDSGLSDATANGIIKRMKSRTDIDQEKLSRCQRRMVGIGRQNLRLAKNSGLISQDEYDTLNSQYPNYVPFWNAFDPDTDMQTDGAEQFVVPANVLKARTGRTADSLNGDTKFFADRLAAMADQRFRVMRKAANNEALKRLLKLASRDGGENLEVFTPTTKPIRLKDGRIGSVPDTSWRQDPTVFRVMVGGQTVLLRVKHAPLAKAIRSKQVPPHILTKIFLTPLQMYTSVFRYFTTQFGNPDFLLTNPVRDVQTGMAAVIGENRRLSTYKGGKAKGLSMVDRLRIVARSAASLPVGWGATFGLGTESVRRDYAKYRALGGRQGFYTQQDPAKSRKALAKAVRAGTPVTGAEAALYKTGNVVTMPVKMLAKVFEHLNTMFDDGVRFATYRQLVREGVDPQKAIEVSRDLTVDFSKMGTAGPAVNGLYAYSNAAVQGSTKTLRLLKSKAGRSVFAGYILAGILSELWNDDEEDRDKNLKSDWDELPDYQKDMNIHIRLPEGFGSDETEAGYVKVPVAYGLDVPFVMGRRLVRYIKGKETFGEASLATISSAVNSFVPFGAGQIIGGETKEDFLNSTARMLAPDALDPMIGLIANKDWLNNSIYNEPFPTDPLPVPSEMGRDRTPQWSKDLSSMINTLTGGNDIEPGALSIQPEILPYILSSQFSGTGKTAQRAIDMVASNMQRRWIEANYPDEADELIQDLDWDDIPGIRRFISSAPYDRDREASYYEYSQIAREADAAIRKYAEAGRGEEVERIVGEQMPALSIVEIDKEIRKIKTAMRDVKESMRRENIDPNEIDVEMRRFANLIKELKSQANLIYREEEQRAKAEAGAN